MMYLKSILNHWNNYHCAPTH